jgi:hypothetical protein
MGPNEAEMAARQGFSEDMDQRSRPRCAATRSPPSPSPSVPAFSTAF